MVKPRRKAPGGATQRRPKKEQWWGIRRELEHYECDVESGEVFRPDLVAWLNADGKVRAMLTVPPDMPDDCLVDLLEEAERDPLPGSGAPGRADVLMVDDEDLCDAVLARYPRRVVQIDTSELANEYVDGVVEEFGSAADLPHETLLEEELVSREAVVRYLDAFQRFYASVPWDALAELDPTVTRVRIPALGIDNGCLIVFADAGERGLSFFMSPDDLAFGGGELSRGVRPLGMRHFEASAEMPDDVDPARIDELDELGVSLDAYAGWCPGISTFDYDDFKRPLVPADLRLATLCVEALGKLFRMPGAPVATPPEVTLTVSLEGDAAPTAVSLTTPHPDAPDLDSDDEWDGDPDLDDEIVDDVSALSPAEQARVRQLVETLFPSRRTQGISIPLVGPSGAKPALPHANDPCACGSGKRFKDCHGRN